MSVVNSRRSMLRLMRVQSSVNTNKTQQIKKTVQTCQHANLTIEQIIHFRVEITWLGSSWLPDETLSLSLVAEMRKEMEYPERKREIPNLQIGSKGKHVTHRWGRELATWSIKLERISDMSVLLSSSNFIVSLKLRRPQTDPSIMQSIIGSNMSASYRGSGHAGMSHVVHHCQNKLRLCRSRGSWELEDQFISVVWNWVCLHFQIGLLLAELCWFQKLSFTFISIPIKP